MGKVAVTTSRKASFEVLEQAVEIAGDLDIEYISREQNTISRMLRKNGLTYVLVVQADKISLQSEKALFYWHPNTSVLKIRDLVKGSGNFMVEAMKLKKGFSVLDCTLGLAADALVASAVVGEQGTIVGLEVNKYLAFLTRRGLAKYEQQNNIQVIHTEYEDYLRNQADNSYDVVYFDPMFEEPKQTSNGINALRHFADHRSLSPESVEDALRVCKRRVVIKSRLGSGDFKILGVSHYFGYKRAGTVVYGVIEKSIHQTKN